MFFATAFCMAGNGVAVPAGAGNGSGAGLADGAAAAGAAAGATGLAAGAMPAAFSTSSPVILPFNPVPLMVSSLIFDFFASFFAYGVAIILPVFTTGAGAGAGAGAAGAGASAAGAGAGS